MLARQTSGYFSQSIKQELSQRLNVLTAYVKQVEKEIETDIVENENEIAKLGCAVTEAAEVCDNIVVVT